MGYLHGQIPEMMIQAFFNVEMEDVSLKIN